MTDLKWMISSDQHFPFHDPRYIELWFKVLKGFKPDIVDYLGDTSDQACFSRWTDGSSSEFIKKITATDVEEMFTFVESEERPALHFYEETRAMLPNAQLFVALGNHDIRIFDYLDKKLPELVAKATPENLWKLDSLGYDYIYYGDLPKHRFGDIHVHHGVSISKHAGESARNDVETFGVSMVRGHSHRMGSYFRTHELRNETLRGYEIGHMTDIKSSGMAYTNVHNWQPGFAIAHIESGASGTKDGLWPHVQLIQISADYTCYVDGIKYSA
jgi:hypothetical protein